MGDNGSSGEGGLTGTYNELVHLNGIFDAETTESMLARAEDWGGPNSLEKEAIANSVYPLDDRAYEPFNAAIAGRSDMMGDRTSLTLAHGMTRILENTFINEKNTTKTIVANIDLKGSDRGVILC